MTAIAGHRRDSIVLGAAVGLIGLTFGVLASAAGFTVAKASAMSLLVFTGASQFAVVGVLGSGGSPVSAVGGAMLLAARNTLYGMRLSDTLARSGRRKYLGAQLVIDESAAMSAAQTDQTEADEAFWFTGVSVFVFWNVATVLGVLLGSVIGDPEVWGLDAAFPASFVALLGPHIATAPGRVAAIVGAAIALVAVPFSPAGAPILFAALAIVPALFVRDVRDRRVA